MKDEGRALADGLRPDRCKVVIDAAKDAPVNYVRCDPGYPKAWQQQKVQKILAALEHEGKHIMLVTLAGSLRRLHTVAMG